MPSGIPRTSVELLGIHIRCVWKKGMTPPTWQCSFAHDEPRCFSFYHKKCNTKPVAKLISSEQFIFKCFPKKHTTTNHQWYKVNRPTIAELVYDFRITMFFHVYIHEYVRCCFVFVSSYLHFWCIELVNRFIHKHLLGGPDLVTVPKWSSTHWLNIYRYIT